MLFNNKNTVISRLGRQISIILFIILLSAYASELYAQKRRNEPPPLKERLFFGGSFGLQFGTITDIQISPVVGIWLLPRLAIAVGPNYRFYKYYSTKTDIYGVRAYSEFMLVQDINNIIPLGAHTGIFLHFEDELLSLKSSFWKNSPITSDRFYINTALAGGGLSQQIGRRASFNIMVLWALNDSYYDIYSNPEIRVAFTF